LVIEVQRYIYFVAQLKDLIYLPVANFVVVQVAESIESLAHHECCLRLCQVLSLCDEKEKFTSFAQSTGQTADQYLGL